MAESNQVKSIDQGKPFAAELEAMRSTHATLTKLDVEARLRVLAWLQSAVFEGEPIGMGIIRPHGPIGGHR